MFGNTRCLYIFCKARANAGKEVEAFTKTLESGLSLCGAIQTIFVASVTVNPVNINEMYTKILSLMIMIYTVKPFENFSNTRLYSTIEQLKKLKVQQNDTQNKTKNLH